MFRELFYFTLACDFENNMQVIQDFYDNCSLFFVHLFNQI